MRLLYSLLLYLISPLLLGYLVWRSLREPGYRGRWGQRFGLFPADLPRGCLWIHAASMGEVQAAAVLIRRLQQYYPERPLLVTTMTPTGSDQVRKLLGEDVRHCYLPFDMPHAVSAFLSAARPALALIVEMELWPNLFHAVRRRGIPLLLVNARLSERSARRYRRLRPLMAPVVAVPARVCAQSPDDARRLRELGAPSRRVVVSGSLKFDQHIPASAREQGESLRLEMGGSRPVWIAASTRDGEEEQVLAAFARIRRSLPGALLLLVPRHPDRFSRVEILCRDAGYRVHRRSSGQPCPEEADIYLGDTMGELPVFYGAADVAFVGGTLVPVGGHNLLEPAAMGLPVVVGPHVFNFSLVTAQLVQAGGCLQVTDADGLAQVVTELLADPARRGAVGSNALALVQANRGAVDRILCEVERVLPSDRGVEAGTGQGDREQGGRVSQ